MSLTLDYVSMPPKSQEISQIQNAEQIRYEHDDEERKRRQKHSGKQKNNSSDNKKETKKEPHFDMRI